MEAKNWLSADLVFDVDIDMEFLNYKDMDVAKQETQKLIDFLTDDFAFSPHELNINFSGSKGYHIHVSNSNILELGKDERRAIVDYVSARGLNLKRDSLWKKRVEEKFVNFIKNSDVSDFQKIEGIGEKTAKQMFDRKNDLLAQIKRGQLEGISGVRERIFNKITDEMKVSFTGDTDESVTADTSKLIRLPDTLHGGTGLIAKKVENKNFEKFDPLKDALAFDSEEIKIKIKIDELKLKEKLKIKIKFEMNEQSFDIKGKYATLPMYAGIYLMLKGFCDVLI